MSTAPQNSQHQSIGENSISLASVADGRDNNFNLIRLIAAAMVLISHSYGLVGNKASEPFFRIAGITMGYVSVDVFFIASGFLVTASLFRRPQFLQFAKARALRIYPGLLVALLFTVVVVGGSFTSLPAAKYFTHPDTYLYFFKNLSLIGTGFASQSNLPGLFLENHHQMANGSLWTLPWEIRMYALLAIVGMIFRRHLTMVVILIAISSTILKLGLIVENHSLGEATRSTSRFLSIGNGPTTAIRFLSCFFIGGTFYCLRNYITLKRGIFYGTIVVLILLCFTKNQPLLQAAYVIAAPYLLFYIAYVPRGLVRAYNRLGDYSYGVYIYACPIQQVLIKIFPNIDHWSLTALALPVTMILAIASWKFIEQPWLRRK